MQLNVLYWFFFNSVMSALLCTGTNFCIDLVLRLHFIAFYRLNVMERYRFWCRQFNLWLTQAYHSCFSSLSFLFFIKLIHANEISYLLFLLHLQWTVIQERVLCMMRRCLQTKSVLNLSPWSVFIAHWNYMNLEEKPRSKISLQISHFLLQVSISVLPKTSKGFVSRNVYLVFFLLSGWQILKNKTMF